MSNTYEEPAESKPIDLSEFEHFTFNTQWSAVESSDRGSSYDRDRRSRRKNGFKNKRFSQDRRESFKAAEGEGQRPYSRSDRGGDRKFRHYRSDFQSFIPIVDVEFYPNDSVFEGIITVLKGSCKTYELFSVAKMFLEKPERFAMVVKKKEGATDRMLYLTVGDSFVFETQEQAVLHILRDLIDKYFDQEEREVVAPTGTFSCLHKCGLTGKVLCPPNYHRYQEVLVDHYDRFIRGASFEKFKESIVKTSEPEEIESWKVSAAKETVFLPKNEKLAEGQPRTELHTFAEMRHYFMEHLLSEAVVPYSSVRLPGDIYVKLPRSLLKKSISALIEKEKRFPLRFANNLRGRLRRSGFTIYKMGGKSGISYVCGIKRKFRTSKNEAFEEGIQKVLNYVDAHRGVKISTLCHELVADVVGEPTESLSPEIKTFMEQVDTLSDENIPELKAAITEVKTAVDELNGIDKKNKEAAWPEKEAIMRDLHWLIREGYIAEFEDGSLIATGILSSLHEKEQIEREESLDEEAEPAAATSSHEPEAPAVAS